jgi:dihydrofolate reductase
MKITLFMAITVNGYIAGLDDDTEWVKDLDALNSTITASGVIVMGKRTYLESDKYNAFPYKSALNIVMTHDPQLLSKTIDSALFTDASPAEVVQIVADQGFDHLLLIGGGHLNGSFLTEGLIDELIIDIHPLLKAQGIRLFESEFGDQSLELVSSAMINDQIMQMRYRVKK